MDYALVVLALTLGAAGGVDWDTLAPVVTWDTLAPVASHALDQAAPTLPAAVPFPPAALPPGKPVEASAPPLSPASPCAEGNCPTGQCSSSPYSTPWMFRRRR